MKIKINKNIEILKRKDNRTIVFNKKTKRLHVIGELESKILLCIKDLKENEDIYTKCSYIEENKLDRLLYQFQEMGFFKNVNEKSPDKLYKIRWRLFSGDRFINPTSFFWEMFYFLVTYFSIPIFSIGLLSVFYKNINILDLVTPIVNITPQNIISYMLILITSLFLHEVSHAVVAIFNDVNVPEVGLMLYWGIPSAYANLSTIKLQQEKKKRLQIFFSGIQMNLLLSGIGLIYLSFWKSTNVFIEEMFSFLFLMNISFVFLNLQFFIKLDGYFILQELLGIDNLKEKANNELLKIKPTRKKRNNYNIKITSESNKLFLENLTIKLYAYGSLVYIPSIVILLIVSIVRLNIWR